MKTLYIAGLQHTKILEGMAKHPFLFGVWHGYQMVVLSVYNAHRPLCTTLEFCDFVPHLTLMDCMLLEIFLWPRNSATTCGPLL